MENYENNYEVMETVTEVIEPSSGKGLKAVGGIAALAALGFGAYKLIKHFKKKKEEEDQDVVLNVPCKRSKKDEDEDDE